MIFWGICYNTSLVVYSVWCFYSLTSWHFLVLLLFPPDVCGSFPSSSLSAWAAFTVLCIIDEVDWESLCKLNTLNGLLILGASLSYEETSQLCDSTFERWSLQQVNCAGVKKLLVCTLSHYYLFTLENRLAYTGRARLIRTRLIRSST